MKIPTYKTTDMGTAAYLCVRGFTLLGAVDNGRTNHYGHPTYDFYLTHSNFRDKAEEMYEYVLDCIEGYEKPFYLDGDETQKPVSFKEFRMRLRNCTYAAKYPVSKDQVEA